MSLLLTVVTDLYDGNRKSLSLELERQTEMTINQLTVEGLGRSGGMVEALQRVYRDGLRSHETLLRESLQRVEFIPINLQVPTEPSESGITAKVS